MHHVTTDLKFGSCTALSSSCPVIEASKLVPVEVESRSQTPSLRLRCHHRCGLYYIDDLLSHAPLELCSYWVWGFVWSSTTYIATSLSSWSCITDSIACFLVCATGTTITNKGAGFSGSIVGVGSTTITAYRKAINFGRFLWSTLLPKTLPTTNTGNYDY